MRAGLSGFLCEQDRNCLMEIPYKAIPPETLRNMIEELITREGTDYGEQELALASKVKQVMLKLERGEAAILYDEALETCEIVLTQ